MLCMRRGVEQSGSSAGSYPEGRKFKSSPRHQWEACLWQAFLVPAMDLKDMNRLLISVRSDTNVLIGGYRSFEYC